MFLLPSTTTWSGCPIQALIQVAIWWFQFLIYDDAISFTCNMNEYDGGEHTHTDTHKHTLSLSLSLSLSHCELMLGKFV